MRKDYRSVRETTAIAERDAKFATVLLLWALVAPLGAGAAAFAAGRAGMLLVATALLPPLLTLGCRAWWDRPLGRLLAQAAWLALAVGAVLTSGGFASPAWPLFLIPPALSWCWTGQARWSLAVSLGMAAPALALGWTHRELAPAGAAALGLGALALALAGASLRLTSRPLAAAHVAQAPHALAELGHELRTPLHQILGFAEIIEQRFLGDAPERYASYAGLIRSSGAHLLTLADTWLEQARLQAGVRSLAPERLDLAGLVQETARGFERHLAEKQQKLAWHVFCAPLWVSADRAAWRQILTNLISNAIKFTPVGGKVAISLTFERNRVRLSVEDSGPGVPAAERWRLARPFVRGAAATGAEGAGLGLSIVKGLLGLQGGRLEIGASNLGGARFTAHAPLEAIADGAPAPQ